LQNFEPVFLQKCAVSKVAAIDTIAVVKIAAEIITIAATFGKSYVKSCINFLIIYSHQLT